jgi:hypothetical protein
MEYGHWPFILVEVVLVFGSVLAFAWWQLRDLDRERREAERKRRRAQNADSRDTDASQP